jgi:hypothetical protein
MEHTTMRFEEAQQASRGRRDVPREFIPESIMDDPTLYDLWLDGDCMEPTVRDGSFAICSRETEPQHGDLTVIWILKGRPLLKQQIGMLPPLAFHPDSEIMPLYQCRQINPQKAYAIPVDEIDVVHKVVAVIPAEQVLEDGRAEQ